MVKVLVSVGTMDDQMKLHTCSADASVKEQNCTMSWSAFGGESESIEVVCVVDSEFVFVVFERRL